MKNKIIVSTILLIAVLIFSFFALSQERNRNQTPVNETTPTNQTAITQDQPKKQIILFYGDGCPHCAKVEKYIEENNIKDKIAFEEKEVYHNQNNAKELEDKAKICGLSSNSIGVPFLWDGKKCLIGDQDIINFFKQKINEQ